MPARRQLTTSRANSPRLDHPQLFVRGREDVASVFRHHDGVLDADAAEAFEVNPGLDGNGHPGAQRSFLALAEAWRLVDLQAQAMAGGMDERAIQPVSFQD